MVLLVGLIRIYTGHAFMSREWQLRDKYLLKVLLLSFVYSSIIAFLGLFFMRPMILGLALVLGDKIDVGFAVTCCFLVYLLLLYGVEWKNNRSCLEGFYDNRRIWQATLLSHVSSLVVMVVYVTSTH